VDSVAFLSLGFSTSLCGRWIVWQWNSNHKIVTPEEMWVAYMLAKATLILSTLFAQEILIPNDEYWEIGSEDRSLHRTYSNFENLILRVPEFICKQQAHHHSLRLQDLSWKGIILATQAPGTFTPKFESAPTENLSDLDHRSGLIWYDTIHVVPPKFDNMSSFNFNHLHSSIFGHTNTCYSIAYWLC